MHDVLGSPRSIQYRLAMESTPGASCALPPRWMAEQTDLEVRISRPTRDHHHVCGTERRAASGRKPSQRIVYIHKVAFDPFHYTSSPYMSRDPACKIQAYKTLGTNTGSSARAPRKLVETCLSDGLQREVLPPPPGGAAGPVLLSLWCRLSSNQERQAAEKRTVNATRENRVLSRNAI